MPRIGQFSRETINTQAFKQAFRELASSMWPLTMPRLMAAPPVTSQTVSALMVNIARIESACDHLRPHHTPFSLVGRTVVRNRRRR